MCISRRNGTKMIKEKATKTHKVNNLYQYTMVFTLFLVGIQNSSPYISHMGFNSVNKLVVILIYVSIVFLTLVSVLDLLYKKREISIKNSFVKYISILIVAIVLKIIILFIQSPGSFFPGGNNFSFLLTQTRNFLLMILAIIYLQDQEILKKAIFAFGIGASFSAIIPFVFFPEMIGSRMILVDGKEFVGAFWNSAVISYMSVGWLLITLSIFERSQFKKLLLQFIFFFVVLASLSGLSRATLLSLIISGFTYLMFSNQLKRYIKTIIILVIFIGIISIFFQETIENFIGRLDNGMNISEESRVRIWKEYIGAMPDYFFFGEISGNYTKYSLTNHSPHSVVLNWFTQFGVLAVLGFLTMLLGVLRAIRLIKDNFGKYVSAGIVAWLTGYLSIAMINETGFHQLSVYAGFGIVLAWGNILQKKKIQMSLVKEKV